MTVAFFYSMQGIFLDNLHFISDIESLHIDFFTGLNNDLPLSPLYSTIMNLKTLKLESIEACIAFNVLRRFNRCYNSLTSIEFNNCKFNESISYNGFDQLTQLQSFHLNYCEGLTEKIFEALQDIPVLSNIRTLSVRGKIITGLDLLIQRIGTNLEHVHLELNGFVERGKEYEKDS
ncbi:10762_t:CDS:2 [Funneliformis geosporum]|uniref:10762_t:CDS:1 n=1 Tax=Funneliformis geosporum TaxID=1117311 RepID=A0A9W4WRU4_9GLOM|nr:10762_t:CDS:2 [Funneliformis geosporum]